MRKEHADLEAEIRRLDYEYRTKCYDEKLVMYMRLKKKDLAEMLIVCNSIIDDMAKPYSHTTNQTEGGR